MKKKVVDVSHVPLSVFRDRSLSVLEVMVEYLHEVKGLNFKSISLLLNRNQRTIWTVYHRVQEKRKRQLQ